MPHYKLTPRDLNDPNWVASKNCRPCLVRGAANEDAARDAATREFWKAEGKTPEGLVPRSPWNDPELVSCVESQNITPNTFPGDGETIVLLPDDDQ